MNFQGMKEAAALPAWFKDHPLTKSILKEAADGILKQRTAAQKEIDRLRKEAAALIPGMQAAITDAEIELQLLEEHKRELQEKYFKAARALLALNYATERQIEAQEAILRETRDPAIDEAIEFFRDEARKLRLPSAIRQIESKGQKGLTMKQEICLRTNYGAILEAIDYSRAAIEELEAMKLHPECEAARIEALKTGIPSIDVYIASETYGYAIPD